LLRQTGAIVVSVAQPGFILADNGLHAFGSLETRNSNDESSCERLKTQDVQSPPNSPPQALIGLFPSQNGGSRSVSLLHSSPGSIHSNASSAPTASPTKTANTPQEDPFDSAGADQVKELSATWENSKTEEVDEPADDEDEPISKLNFLSYEIS